MNDQEAFLQALAANEDDVTTRMIYADWLDEHDQPEEADRQRKWPAAKAWLQDWVVKINGGSYEDKLAEWEAGLKLWMQGLRDDWNGGTEPIGPDYEPTEEAWADWTGERPVPEDFEYGSRHNYQDAIDAGHAAVSGQGYCFGTDEGSDYFWRKGSGSADFFRNWSIITGVQVPASVVKSPPFRCAC